MRDNLKAKKRGKKRVKRRSLIQKNLRNQDDRTPTKEKEGLWRIATRTCNTQKKRNRGTGKENGFVHGGDKKQGGAG